MYHFYAQDAYQKKVVNIITANSFLFHILSGHKLFKDLLCKEK